MSTERRGVLFVGDLHIRKDEWAVQACKKVLARVVELTQSTEHGSIDTVVFLGDVFHQNRPYPEEIRIFLDFLYSLDSRVTVYVLAGNHEYLESRDTFVEELISVKKSGFHLVTEPRVEDLGFCNVVFLPYIPLHRILKNWNRESMKEVYESVVFPRFEQDTSIDRSKKTIAVYHFEDETQFIGIDQEGVSLRALENIFPDLERIGGHVHNQVRNYLGTPYQTRADEFSNEAGRLAVYVEGEQNSEYIELPFLVKYETIHQGDEVKRPEPDTYMMLKVVDVPSVESLARYREEKNACVYDWELRVSEERSIDTDEDKTVEGRTILQVLDDFIFENRVNPDTARYLKSIMG